MSGLLLTTRFLAVTLAADAAWPTWAIALAVAGILALAVWTYRSAGQHSARAEVLAVLRAVAALSLLALLARPTLVLSWQLHPKPVLTLALDTSASMARADVIGRATGSLPAGVSLPGATDSLPASASLPGATRAGAISPVGPMRPMGAMPLGATPTSSAGAQLSTPNPTVLPVPGEAEGRNAAEQGRGDHEPELPTRLDAAVSRLSEKRGALLAQLAQRYQLQLAAVSDRIVSRCTIDSPGRVPQALDWLAGLKPDGRMTDLAADVREILATTAADDTLAGIVLLSDGRRNTGAPLANIADALAAAHCPAVAVPVGSDSPLPDIALAGVQAPPRAFVGEPIAIRGRLELSGVPTPVAATLKLVDESTGRVVADRPASLEPPPGQSGALGQYNAATPVALTYRPDKPGQARLLLKVESTLKESNLRNNQTKLQVDAVDARIRVLYVEQDSRFEYRYLKNLLARDPAMISSVLLLSADPEFPQEGSEPIRRFPASLQELDRYDVVLIGDVDPKGSWTDARALHDLAAWVEQKGGGLGWIAGPRVALNVWTDTPLGKVLPIRPDDKAPAQPPEAEGYRPLLTPQGAESSIFLLDTGNVPAEQVIASLPDWYWAAAPGIAKPAAEILAVHPRLRSAEGPAPLVVIGHYGAGQTFYCASDDVWRWRRFRDVDHWRAFWLQTIRWLASPRKLGAYRKVVLGATPEKVQVGQPVSLELRVHDEILAADLPDRLGATIRDDGSAARNVWLQPTAGLAAYTASVSPDRAGTYTAEVSLPAATQPATATFTVELPEAETADSPADSAALKQWVTAVQQAGAQGYVLNLNNLTELASLPLPAGQPRRHTIDLRLWDNALALLLVCGLFLAEWSWRRTRGMV